MLVHERTGRSHSRTVPLLLLATYALIRLDPDMTPRVEVRVSGLVLLLLLLLRMSLWNITVAVLLITMTALVLLTFLRLVLLQLLL